MYKLADFWEGPWGLGRKAQLDEQIPHFLSNFYFCFFKVPPEVAVSATSQHSRKHNHYAGITLLIISSMSSEIPPCRCLPCF